MIRVTLWGTRGSIAAPGPETTRYGGNTACVEVRGSAGTVLVLDGGTGARRLGGMLRGLGRLDILLTHLHVDHIMGLGFFAPLYWPDLEVHLWGPASTTESLRARLARYMSPPLFPVRLRDLPCCLVLHEVPCLDVAIGEFRVSATLVCHPGPTVGYRISGNGASICYIPDHEPALGLKTFPLSGDWTSGYELARDADLLIHDAQYSPEEYEWHVGWGHSSLVHAFTFASHARVKRLVPFHHDPSHTDGDLDTLIRQTTAEMRPTFSVTPGIEGSTVEVSSRRDDQ